MGRRQELEQRQSLLARFGRMVAAETSLDTLLTIIAEEVRNILSADRCSVFLVDFYKGELWTKIALGMEEKVLRIPIGQGIAGFVARRRLIRSRAFSQSAEQGGFVFLQPDFFNGDIDLRVLGAESGNGLGKIIRLVENAPISKIGRF